jgi:uncharacterized protein
MPLNDEQHREEIVRLTTEHGGQWAINHTRRLLELIAIIGEGLEYDDDAIWLAAHLHDWGGYAPWAKPGVDHALRSTEVAGPFLAERGYPADLIERILQCIEHHHSGDPCHSIEAILLADADALDFLGVVGVLRDISKKPRDLRAGYETTTKRRARLPAMLCLEKSRELAAERIQEMDELLRAFERDSFGFF